MYSKHVADIFAPVREYTKHVSRYMIDEFEQNPSRIPCKIIKDSEKKSVTHRVNTDPKKIIHYGFGPAFTSALTSPTP